MLSVPDLEPLHTLGDRDDRWLASVTVSGNGRWLAADYFNGEVRVWEVASGAERSVLPKRRPKTDAVYLFHPRDDVLYLYRRGEGLHRLDVAADRDLGEIAAVKDAERMTLSPDGRFLAVAGTCRLRQGRPELCVRDEVEGSIIAAGDLDSLFGETVVGTRDLVFSDSRSEVRPSANPRNPFIGRGLRGF